MLPDLDNKLALNSYVIDDVVDLADQMSNPVMFKDGRGDICMRINQVSHYLA